MQAERIIGSDDTIAAPATPAGGALGIIRMSGPHAVSICDGVFRGRRPLAEAAPSTVHYGNIVDGDEVIDDVLVTVFRAPHSYTGEDSVEISAHGSSYIVGRILSLLASRGARPAEAGEFTQRAFMNGRMDLSQAEAVADMIASDSRASHAIAVTQMRGRYSDRLHALRDELLHIASLLELELDFSEEDVEFADRGELAALLHRIRDNVSELADSFEAGNAMKNGVTVAIAGRPNVGKSTLLNRLLGEERAMVSDIAGTTRDTVEAEITIDGLIYRFIDTAGIRRTDDRLEQMGIRRTEQALQKARIILWLSDDGVFADENDLFGPQSTDDRRIYRIITKSDLNAGIADAGTAAASGAPASESEAPIRISAKTGEGMDKLLAALRSTVDTDAAYSGNVIVSTRRHYDALRLAREALDSAISAMEAQLPPDLLSEDIRQVMYHLGTITGEITSDDILKSIFSSFCIGK